MGVFSDLRCPDDSVNHILGAEGTPQLDFCFLSLLAVRSSSMHTHTHMHLPPFLHPRDGKKADSPSGHTRKKKKGTKTCCILGEGHLR